MPGLSEAQLFSLFHATAERRLVDAAASGIRFAYYTSADTAKKVIEQREIWLRSPTCMNDFSEIQYGMNMFTEGWRSNEGIRLQKTIDHLLPGTADRLFQEITGPGIRQLFSDTFIACVSEHDETEREFGRLSMWRAYGADSGVALIFSSDVFSSEGAPVGAYSSPVEYLDQTGYRSELAQLEQRLRASAAQLRFENPDDLFERFKQTIMLAILCVKHRAFREEREWRIFSMDPLDRGRLQPVVESIQGVVQRVLKLHFDPQDGPRATLDQLEEVLIGPTQYPIAMHAGFLQLLAEADIANPGTRVKLTGIPLRVS